MTLVSNMPCPALPCPALRCPALPCPALPCVHPMWGRYQKCGQPVLIGGSMGTSSYVLVGTQGAMEQTFGSTCHGAGRAMSRAQSKKTLGYKEVCPPPVMMSTLLFPGLSACGVWSEA